MAPFAGLWRNLFEQALSHLQVGRLRIVFPDGRRHAVEGRESGPEAELEIRDMRGISRLLKGGDMGFAEAYMAGEVDSPDLTDLIELAARNQNALARALNGKAWVRALNRIGHLMRANTRAGARRNIAYHYDLGNAFYREWLDPTMTYSAAWFEDGANDLQAAQTAKYRRMAALAELGAGQRVLEIGCGWGGFAEIAAREFDCHVTGLTLSREQLAFAQDRMQRQGLADRVELRLEDYRDCRDTFDGIVSIEMFEAVGEAHWRRYFGVLRDRLRAGGNAALQIITIAEDRFDSYRRNADFIQRYIFPGGMLPTRSALRQLAAEASLVLASETGFGTSYARTLREWRSAFLGAWPRIQPLGFDERFRRMWTYYLAYCEAGFRAGSIDVVHLKLCR
ncbi:cyclopropane-fatty-acyl-phospholipid synthase [Dongia mobilis]|uniref:Cyclopropane-fatty-acyl-phospholipid synthase n=2 Tax=Dongia mobilis TaxID=578943 RepID=A0A4R6WIS9_9PROT|nr:cyclopropane-fatty-acyl-phospholipid synthase [Dongia mobilis]